MWNTWLPAVLAAGDPVVVVVVVTVSAADDDNEAEDGENDDGDDDGDDDYDGIWSSSSFCLWCFSHMPCTLIPNQSSTYRYFSFNV